MSLGVYFVNSQNPLRLSQETSYRSIIISTYTEKLSRQIQCRTARIVQQMALAKYNNDDCRTILHQPF